MEDQNKQGIDLRRYRWEGDWDWLINAKTSDEGDGRIMAQIGFLSDRMRNMKVGDTLSVLEICHNPKYYEVAVKILCVIICSWRYADRKEQRDYVFNARYTEVRRTI